MSRNDVRRHLVDNGMPTNAAGNFASGYSIGVLLHEP